MNDTRITVKVHLSILPGYWLEETNYLEEG